MCYLFNYKGLFEYFLGNINKDEKILVINLILMNFVGTYLDEILRHFNEIVYNYFETVSFKDLVSNVLAQNQC